MRLYCVNWRERNGELLEIQACDARRREKAIAPIGMLWPRLSHQIFSDDILSYPNPQPRARWDLDEPITLTDGIGDQLMLHGRGVGLQLEHDAAAGARKKMSCGSGVDRAGPRVRCKSHSVRGRQIDYSLKAGHALRFAGIGHDIFPQPIDKLRRKH